MNQKIKVLHIITELELGGAQLFTLYTVENISKDNFIPFLITNNKGILNKEYKNKNNYFFINNLTREINPIKDFLSLIKLYRMIKRIKPDIIHTHSSKAGVLGRWAGFFARVPIIIHTVHGFGFSPFHSKLRRVLYIFLEKLTAKITDHLIFVSKDNLEEGKSLKINSEKKSSIIRSIIGLENFKNNSLNKQKLKKLWKFPPDKIIVGGVFCFKPQKDPIGFLKIAKMAVEKNRNLVFYIAGDGEIRKPMEDYIYEHKLGDKINLLGWVNNTAQLLPAFDVLLLTSLWEGLPQVIIQALVSKVKVVASYVNGVRDIIKDGENGFVFPPKNYDTAVKKLLLAIKDKKLENRLENISDLYFNKFNPMSMVKRQEELYMNLIKKKDVRTF
jgi:glycosyltransferase involved in cell wall biosynthesis